MQQDDDYSAGEESDDSNANKFRSKPKGDISEGNKRLNVPYTHPTPIFKAIEKQQWESVLMFLNTSKWSNSFFVSTTDHFKNPTPFIQCQTWVTSYERGTRQEEWSQLPIHAAISYAAPAVVIQKIVELYPDALKMRDLEGMLPVHLAFGFAAPDPVLSMLLKNYPESAQERGPGGRLPHQCCELGPNKIRGEVFGMVAEQTSDLARKDQEKSYTEYIKEYHKRHEIEETGMEEKDLKAILRELMEDRKQLLDLKRKIKKKSEKESTAESSAEPRKVRGAKSPRGEKAAKASVAIFVPIDDAKLPNDTNQPVLEETQNMSIAGISISTTPKAKSIKSEKNKLTTPKSTKSSKASKSRIAQ
jgi:hypothetical protein